MVSIYKVEAIIKNKRAFDATTVDYFVKTASRFRSEIKIIKNGNIYNAKSLMGILTMLAERGKNLIIAAEGKDEVQATEALHVFIENKI
ncbi:HPr family phosphocarrier protein [Clostridiisalibacter paucivorans]|uniref:HPr family phosphocarrier protein n=1 Tax=Clostridiisalibacter paucivorans TaxID=408753 RepID=UPI0006877553|nr:HPr family phosphocarrier protein [Clostridiisalibacter paucivorans]